MKIRKALLVSLMVVLSVAPSVAAQTFGQFTTAKSAAEGEGSVFLLAGNDAFRTGASARFNVSRFSDFGLQLGLDRTCSESFYGGGADFKLILLEDTKKLPLDLALDASCGGLHAKRVSRFLFDFGILASGVINPPALQTIEPYLSFIVHVEQKNNASSPDACPCTHVSKTDTDEFVRAGVRLTITDETQVMFEARIGDKTLLGAAFNVIF